MQPKMAGEVLEVYFQSGDVVEQGQVLCRIDSDALTALKLQMDSAAVAVRNAENTLNRTRSLYGGGFVSQENMEQAENSWESAKIAYDSAKNQYDLQVEHTTVTAPLSGVIESRSIDPHDHIKTDTVICTISGGDGLQVKFGITEKILANMSVGDTVELEKNGTAYEGKITEIGTMVNSATGLYDAKASVAEADGLTTGARVKLTVVMSQAKGAMTIPLDAVSYDAGMPFVYCYDQGIARKTVIESGIYDSQTMEVTSGLTEDSAVITSWSNELQDGAEVLLEDESADNNDGQVKNNG